MDNSEYIKKLEARIEVLENQLKNITLEMGKGITIENSTINAIAFEKCKDITIKNANIESLAVVGVGGKLSKNTIHNLDSTKSKTKVVNCTIQNFENK